MEFHHGTTAYSTLVTNVQYSNSCLDDGRLNCETESSRISAPNVAQFAAGIELNFNSSVSSII